MNKRPEWILPNLKKAQVRTKNTIERIDSFIIPENAKFIGNGKKYYTSTDIIRIENYNPEAAPNNYYLIPTPVGGIYPYVMGMMCKKGMLVKDPNGKVYECTLADGATYKLVNEPSTAASIFIETEI